MISNRAIIVGCNGQDGKIMTELLLKKNYEVIGLSRHNFNINSGTSVQNLIRDKNPSEVYFFAAYHHSSEDMQEDFPRNLQKSLEVNTLSPILFLESIKEFSPKTKFFYASSSLIYSPSQKKIDEFTISQPTDSYGISKLAAMNAINFYRSCGLKVCCAILSNHESIHRKENFLSKKIITKAVDAYFGNKNKLILGNLDAEVDWSYALDFMVMAHFLTSEGYSDDFIFASGETRKVREFCDLAFKELNLNFSDFVEEDNSLIKREAGIRNFDNSKIAKIFDLGNNLTFKQMIKTLIQEEIEFRKSQDSDE